MKVSHRSFPLVLLSLFLSFTLLAVCDKEKSSTGPEEITTVTDIDGNTYQTTKIGSQRWIKENLKVTHYRNGDAIPHVTDDSTWIRLTTGAYCCYENDPANGETYGILYNWHAVNDARGLAPEGSHIATDADWIEIIDYLGGADIAGGKMKKTGTTYWTDPNTGASNSSGLSMLPGGLRSDLSGDFSGMESSAFFWTATEQNSVDAVACKLIYNNAGIGKGETDKRKGLSIRCVKD